MDRIGIPPSPGALFTRERPICGVRAPHHYEMRLIDGPSQRLATPGRIDVCLLVQWKLRSNASMVCRSGLSSFHNSTMVSLQKGQLWTENHLDGSHSMSLWAIRKMIAGTNTPIPLENIPNGQNWNTSFTRGTIHLGGVQ